MPTTIWIYYQVEFKFWATIAVNLSRLKSTQYLLICRADLAVSAESEAASEELKRDMLQEFKDAAEKFSMSDDLKGYPTDILMRSKNFIARGVTIWRDEVKWNLISLTCEILSFANSSEYRFSEMQTLFGSQIVENINNYNAVNHMLSNVNLDISQKWGLQQTFGYNNSNAGGYQVSNLQSMNGAVLPQNATGGWSGFLPSILSNSQKLIPLSVIISRSIRGSSCSMQ